MSLFISSEHRIGGVMPDMMGKGPVGPDLGRLRPAPRKMRPNSGGMRNPNPATARMR